MRTLLVILCMTALVAACEKKDCPHDSVFVPAGTFTMGTDRTDITWYRLQLKPRKVTLTESYCLDRTEVTRGAYEQCGKAGVCKRRLDALEDWLRRPQGSVNWAGAKRFCQWRGGTLPTEAQWEYAARYPDGRLYPWGNEPPEPDRWHWKNSKGSDPTADVGSYPKGRSYLGLEDMSGNLKEWTLDVFGLHTQDEDIDPTGPDDGLPMDPDEHVIRGGTFTSMDERAAVATHRMYSSDQGRGDYDTGFRCAYTPR